MKRFLIATALTASLSTAAFAASPAQEAQIKDYLPNVDVSMMSDVQVDQAMNIINSGDGRSTKLGQLDSLVRGVDYSPSVADLSEAEMTILKRAAPDVDLSMVSQAQADTALTMLSSSEGDDTDARVRALLVNDPTPMGDTNTASEAEMVILNRYAPDLDVASLTEAQLNSALAVVYSGRGEGEIREILSTM